MNMTAAIHGAYKSCHDPVTQSLLIIGDDKYV
jgi:hypothetical protein